MATLFLCEFPLWVRMMEPKAASQSKDEANQEMKEYLEHIGKSAHTFTAGQ